MGCAISKTGVSSGAVDTSACEHAPDTTIINIKGSLQNSGGAELNNNSTIIVGDNGGSGGTTGNNFQKRLLQIYREYAPTDADKRARRNILHVAMRKEAPVEKIKEILSAQPRMATAVDVYGHTALHIGLIAGNSDGLPLPTTPLSSPSGSRSRVIHESSRSNVDSLLALIKAYPKAAQIEDIEGRLPLHLAMFHRNSSKVVKALLEIYPRATKLRTNDGYTALHMGMWKNAPMESINAVLLEYPEAASLKTTTGATPLVIGMQNGASVALINTFFTNFPRAMQLTDSVWNTPLHLCFKYGASLDVIMAVLAAYKFSAASKNLDSQTPLHFAMTSNAPIEAVLAILEAHPNAATIADRSQWTPLHLAMKHRAGVEAIEALLNAYPKAAEMADLQGHTPLFLGLKSGVEAASIIAALNACPGAASMRNVEQRTPLHRVTANNAPVAAIKAVMEAYPEALRMQDYMGLTPLHSGIRYYRQDCVKSVLVGGDDSRKDGSNDPSLAVNDDIRLHSLDFIATVLDAFPDACKLMDNNECTPLFDFVHNMHGGGNCAEIKDRNGWEQDQKYSTIETTIVKKIFAAHPRAAEQISSVAGGSPVSVLVAECCKAKSMNRLLKNDACRRLKILLDGLRDGRPLRTLCTSDNPVALQAFFALFDESGCLERLDAPILPKINLNKSIISGWTLLEILADFDTEESSKMVLQIVTRQRAKLLSRSNHDDRLIEIHHHYSKIVFQSIEPVSNTVMTRLADRAKLSISSGELKKWGQEYGRFLRRYRIERDPKHISETCVMVFGTESRDNGEDGRTYEAKVALKFMCEEDSFRREIEKRRNTDEEFVIPIKACFANHACLGLDCSHVAETEFGVDIEGELRPYSKIRLKASKSRNMYLLVMSCGAGVDLHDFIGHQNIAGKDLLVVVTIAKEIARCLQFLNETCGIIHGDVKARNFVARGVGLGFAAIDFDNASSIIDEKVVGNKRTSSGYLPPEMANVEAYHRSRAARAKPAVSIESLKEQLQRALERNFFFEVARISKLCEQAQQTSDQSINAQLPPAQPTATCKYDMWCYGCLLYYLCTGKQLFDVDTREEVDDHELLEIRDWNDGLKREKLSRVDPGWPVQLLEVLLMKNPADRPPNWESVIDQLSHFGSKEFSTRDASSGKLLSNGNNGNLFDRLMVFQSSPLAYADGNSDAICPVPLLDFEREADILNQSLKDAEAIGANIEVIFETATTDRFNAFFAQRMGRVMHLSCHGHPEYLALENGTGGMHPLTTGDLSRFVKSGAGNLKVVVVSACHSLHTGNAFVQAGVPHVVCCRLSEQFNDVGASVFAGSFYRALACQHSLKEAFVMAREAVRVSPLIKDAKIEADKFVLLPEKDATDPYHDVSVFFTREVPPRRIEKLSSFRNVTMPLPRVPEKFLGRELTIYRILERLKAVDLVRVRGVAGVGKSCVVAAVVRYMLKRPKSFSADYFFWLPSHQDHGTDSLSYKRLSQAIHLLAIDSDDTMKSREYSECWIDIVKEFIDKRGYIVIESNSFESESSKRNLERFLRDLLEIAKVKVILITCKEPGTKSQPRLHTRREATIDIGPLDYSSSVLIFGSLLNYGNRKAIQSLLKPADASSSSHDLSQKQRELYSRIGNGIPAEIQISASEMSLSQFQELMKWCESP